MTTIPPEEHESAATPAAPLSGPALQAIAVQAFYDAKTVEERTAAAAKYPVLRQIFSSSYFE